MKTKIAFKTIGLLLGAAALSLSSCSKDKEEELGTVDDHPLDLPVYIELENGSSIPSKEITFHFHDDLSHCDAQRGYMAGKWRRAFINEFIPLVSIDRDPNEVMQPNLAFDGSTNSVWHQHLIVSIGQNDQDKIQIKGHARMGHKITAKDIDIFHTWTNGNQRLAIDPTIVEVKADKRGARAVFIVLWIENKK